MENFNAEAIALMRRFGMVSIADMPALHANAQIFSNVPQQFVPQEVPASAAFTGVPQYFTPPHVPDVPSFNNTAPMPQIKKASAAVPIKAPTRDFFPPTPGFTPEAPSFEYAASKSTIAAVPSSPTRARTPTSEMASSKTAWATPEQMAALAKTNDSMTESKGYVKENATPRSAPKALTTPVQQAKTMPVTTFQPPASMPKSTFSVKASNTGLGANIAKPLAVVHTAAAGVSPESSTTQEKAPEISPTKVSSINGEVAGANKVSRAATVPPYDTASHAVDAKTAASKFTKLIGGPAKSSTEADAPPASKLAKLSNKVGQAVVKTTTPSAADATATLPKTDKILDASKPATDHVQPEKNLNGDRSNKLGPTADKSVTSAKKASQVDTRDSALKHTAANDAAVTDLFNDLTARIDNLTNLWAPEVLPEIQRILSAIVQKLPTAANDVSSAATNGVSAITTDANSATATDDTEVLVDDIILKVKYPDGSLELVGTNSDMRINTVLERIIAKKSSLQETSFDAVSVSYLGRELDHLSTVSQNDLMHGHTIRFTYTKA